MEIAISIQHLHKSYGEIKAVNDFTLEIYRGEVFGLLGPNGAGKTTTVELLEGLRKADNGEIFVLDAAIPDQLDHIKEKIGVQLQVTELPELIRVEEYLALFASYYKKSIEPSRLLAMVGLEEKCHTFTKHLSGGQKQRLAFALALINDPELLILDEPTTGLDPQVRRSIWKVIRNLCDSGKTILLTTHYMEEAERICDRVGIIDHGRLIALGDPRDLIARQNLATAIELDLEGEMEFDRKLFPDIEEVFQEGTRLTIFSHHPREVLVQLVHALDQGTIPIQQISLRKATLEDVFLELTGHKIRE